jgi:hypothetical protein
MIIKIEGHRLAGGGGQHQPSTFGGGSFSSLSLYICRLRRPGGDREAKPTENPTKHGGSYA